jgi:hypothetical protein
MKDQDKDARESQEEWGVLTLGSSFALASHLRFIEWLRLGGGDRGLFLGAAAEQHAGKTLTHGVTNSDTSSGGCHLQETKLLDF